MAAASEQEQIARVLIVEDDAGQRITLRDILQGEGFSTLDCDTAAEALEIVRRERVAVAIVDYKLPDLTGIQTLERLRAFDKAIRVIIHTGYGSFDSAKEAVNLGAFAYLEKPVDPAELVRIVHQAAGRWMEQALRKSQERYRTLAEMSPVGIFHADSAGRYLYVNQRWCEIAGLSVDQPLDTGWEQSLHPDDRDRVLAAWRQAMSGGEAFFSEHRLHSSAGSTRWVDCQTRPEVDGGGKVKGHVGTMTDITERKQAREMLRLLESALEQANLPVAVTTAVSETVGPRYVFVNPAFVRMTGYPADELIGREPRILYGAKTKRAILERQRELMSQGRSFVGELVHYRKDGSQFFMESRVDPVRDADGRITHWVTIYR